MYFDIKLVCNFVPSLILIKIIMKLIHFQLFKFAIRNLAIVMFLIMSSLSNYSWGQIGKNNPNDTLEEVDTNGGKYLNPTIFEPEVFVGSPVSLQPAVVDTLANYFTGYNVISLDLNKLDKYVQSFDGYVAQFVLDMGFKRWTITLIPNDLRSPDFVATLTDAHGERPDPTANDPVNTYKGWLDTLQDNTVRLTLDKDKLDGYFIERDQMGTDTDGDGIPDNVLQCFYYIEPFDGWNVLYVPTDVYRAGDYDGNGIQEEMFVARPNSASARALKYVHPNWQVVWINSGNSIVGWTLRSPDVVLSGNIDMDKKDEIMFLQSPPSAWTTTIDMNASNQFQWNWSNYGSGLLHDWDLRTETVRYMFFKPLATERARLLCFKYIPPFNNNYQTEVSMYRTNQTFNYKTGNEIASFSTFSRNDIKIYPNPSAGIYVIEIERDSYGMTEGVLEYEVVNGMGQKVTEGKLENGLENEYILDLQKLPAGLYKLGVLNGQQRNYSTLIKN